MEMMNIINGMIEEIKGNKIVMYSIIFIIALYTALLNKNISPYIRELYSNKLFKLVIFIVISYVATENITMSIILLIMTLITLQMVTYQEILEEINRKEKFNNYMEDPLLNENELRELGYDRKKIFDVRIPEELNKEVIEEGESKLEESKSLLKDQIKRYDIREQEIINRNNYEALRIIQSGMNRDYESNEGEYMNEEKRKIDGKIRNIIIMENNGYIKYMKIIDFDSKYYNILNGLYNEIVKKYNDLLQRINKDIEEEEFKKEFIKYKIEEYKFIKYVITLKMNNRMYKKEEIELIKDDIEKIEELIKIDERNQIIEKINNLSKIII